MPPNAVPAARIGEIISASITGFTAEADSVEMEGWLQPFRPDFGSFICAEASESGIVVAAVVSNVITAPQDSLHKPVALGLSREQLKAEQPQIFALLRTEIHAVTVGYFKDQRCYCHLPPQPPQVHDFVYHLSDEALKAITDRLDFLRLLVNAAAVPADELIAAAVRHAHLVRGKDYEFLVQAGQYLTHLFKDDYDRLIAALRKIRPDTL